MSIFFASPMYGAKCFGQFHKSAMETAIELTKAGLPFTWSTPWNESLIPGARNNIVAEFLKTDFQTLFFIDGDIQFSVEDVSKLWNMDKDVSCGAYKMKVDGSLLTVWKDGQLKEIEKSRDPMKVDYAGTGFMLIKRSVIEDMIIQYPETNYEEKGEKYAIFDTMIDGDVYLSEDYTFCKRWRDMDGEIWCDPTIKLTHWGLKGFV